MLVIMVLKVVKRSSFSFVSHTSVLNSTKSVWTCFLFIVLVVVGHMELTLEGLLTFTVVDVLAGGEAFETL